MGINMQRQYQSWNITSLKDYASIEDAQNFGTVLQQIDNKLNEIKKEITYWDVYNISSAITSAEQFESKIANLEINNATVINTTYFKRNFQGETTDFHSGDIIIRLKDGSYQHIKAANAGVYIPTLATDNTTDQLTITYEYQTTVSEDDTTKSTTIQTLEGTSSKMYGYSIPGTYNSKENQFSFNIVYQNKYDEDGNETYDESGNLIYDTEKPIIPVLKFFDINNQEVYTDEYTLSSNGSNYSFYLHNNNSGLIQKVVIK